MLLRTDITKVMYYAALIFIPLASGIIQYQDRIPNGFRVPHPCFEAEVWLGVGHQQREGGGQLNPFGRDFRDNDFEWDHCLCQHDSDGDGRSNGEELGDPDCEWVMGEIPKSLSGLSHPGVCEPVGSEQCQGKNDFHKDVCHKTEFNCPAINHQDTVRKVVAFPNITVDPVETSYWCYGVEMPPMESGDQYHIFAMEPYITNPKVVHHIELWDCPNEKADEVMDVYSEPQKCGAMGGCGLGVLIQWSLGIGPVCLGDDHGVRMKHNVSKLRIHYHNPEELQNEIDGSGFVIYYTKDIRTYDVQQFSVMQLYLEIPPGLPSVFANTTCPSRCTGDPDYGITEPIKVIMATTHMHFLGKSSRTELWRDGKFVEVLFEQDNYDYNSPLFVSYEDNPIEILPGDTIHHTCEFQSMERTNVTYRGQSGFDEMCETVLVYYPAMLQVGCKSDGPVHSCWTRGGNVPRTFPDYCDEDTYNEFNVDFNSWMRPELESFCDQDGHVCLPGCTDAIENVTKSHVCMSGEMIDFVKKQDDTVRNMINSCRDWPEAPAPQTPAPPSGDCRFQPPGGEANKNEALVSMLVWTSAVTYFLSKE